LTFHTRDVDKDETAAVLAEALEGGHLNTLSRKYGHASPRRQATSDSTPAEATVVARVRAGTFGVVLEDSS
jgi:hypothetical protein